MPIRDGIVQYALISAFRDHRFRKIEEDELESLECAWVPFCSVVSHWPPLDVMGFTNHTSLSFLSMHWSCDALGFTMSYLLLWPGLNSFPADGVAH